MSLGERPPSAKERKNHQVLSIKMCVDRKLSAIIPRYPSSSANGSVLERIKFAVLLCSIPPKSVGSLWQ